MVFDRTIGLLDGRLSAKNSDQFQVFDIARYKHVLFMQNIVYLYIPWNMFDEKNHYSRFIAIQNVILLKICHWSIIGTMTSVHILLCKIMF